jgi:hypothetical protein
VRGNVVVTQSLLRKAEVGRAHQTPTSSHLSGQIIRLSDQRQEAGCGCRLDKAGTAPIKLISIFSLHKEALLLGLREEREVGVPLNVRVDDGHRLAAARGNIILELGRFWEVCLVPGEVPTTSTPHLTEPLGYGPMSNSRSK